MTDKTPPPAGDEAGLERLKAQIEAIGVRRLALVAAVLAGASVIGTRLMGDPAGLPAPTGMSEPSGPGPSIEEVAGPRMCHADLITTQSGCMAIGALRDPEGRAELEAALPSRAITMVHPTDMAMAPREVETCESFIPLREAGWGGLSGADMRREAVFVRICGLILLSQELEPLPAEAALTGDGVTRLDPASFPGLGEAGFDGSAAFEADPSGAWVITSTELRGRMIPVAAVNADDDPEPEYLVEWSVAADGGTAGARMFGLLDTDEAGGLTFKRLDPFAAG